MLALKSRRTVVDQELCAACVVVKDGVIADVLGYDEVPEGCVVEDFGDQVLMAGLIDPHVHINEPGRTEWEGFETATKAAAAGGITTVVDMPLNSAPVTTTLAALEEKKQAAKEKLWVDCGFYAGLVPGNVGELEALIEGGVLGVKAFLCHSGIDEFPNATRKELEEAMPLLARRGVPLLVHAELVDERGATASDRQSYKEYAASRPQAWEVGAIELLLEMARQTGCAVHVVHLAAAEAVEMLAGARAEGLAVTVETAPHYLFFAEEEIPDADTRYKCAPPIRGRENRDRIGAALLEGVIDFVATDHSPAPPQIKELESGDLVKAWGGISSLQLLLPATWTALRETGAGVVELSRWLSGGAAEFLGLEDRGAIGVGRKADFVVWDPEESFEVVAEELFHRHKVTPYAGERLFGVVKATYLSGEKVYDGRDVSAVPRGRRVQK